MKAFIFFLMASAYFAGCDDREKPCYDAEMEKNHPGMCTMDCPGVCGCDGQEYCNECIANSKGIRVVPCED